MEPFQKCPGSAVDDPQRWQRGSHDGLTCLSRLCLSVVSAEEGHAGTSSSNINSDIFRKKLLVSHINPGLRPHLCVYGLP